MNNQEKIQLNKDIYIKRGLIILALLFGFCFILCHILSLKTVAADGTVTWGLLSFDMLLREAVLDIRNPVATGILKIITWFGDPRRIEFFCLVLLLIRSTRIAYGLPVSLATLFSVTVQTLIKHTVMRPRPDVTEFLISQGGYSFPSGHSCTVLVFFWFMAFLVYKNMKNRKAAYVITALLLAVVPVIGFSRLYLGVHYPTDIFGGWCLGSAILLIAITIYELVAYHRTTVEKKNLTKEE